MPQFKDFPKADARRYMAALLAVSKLGDRATLQYVSEEIGCTRAEVLRALNAAALQFGVEFERRGSAYLLTSWGVLKKAEIPRLLAKESPLIDTPIA